MLEVDVHCQLGALKLQARFDAGAGITALFGRSGAGKTSIVNAVSGLLPACTGRIAIDGRVLLDTAARVRLPAHRRRIGYVFQDGRLFPHLTVRQNLMFGRRFAPGAERWGSLEHVVDLLDLPTLLTRRPARLSGGEQQRVAIGRALLAGPRALVMDEPLASLDGARREEVLPYLVRVCNELRIPALYVSHAMAEVTRIADTLVLVSGGRVVAAGPVDEVIARPDLFPLTGRHEAGA
ncbi:MAG: molybdenum ABC transporter ATP-binding protein, partial [Gammaproteobacteria bacterium]